jgi:hypothetical protein
MKKKTKKKAKKVLKKKKAVKKTPLKKKKKVVEKKPRFKKKVTIDSIVKEFMTEEDENFGIHATDDFLDPINAAIDENFIF